MKTINLENTLLEIRQSSMVPGVCWEVMEGRGGVVRRWWSGAEMGRSGAVESGGKIVDACEEANKWFGEVFPTPLKKLSCKQAGIVASMLIDVHGFWAQDNKENLLQEEEGPKEE
nr:probable serine/threonine-protein phosphatase 2A regulatory subunit B'' subunit TON2 [Tanacetum cinerariifolium]